MNKAIKILSLVSYKYLPPQMGGQKCIAYFYRYLSREMSLTCVTVKNNAEHTEPYTIKPILSNSRLRYINPFYFFLLRRIIRDEKITHLMLEHPYYGWLGLLLKWFCKVKLIIHSHNIESQRFKSMNKWWWGVLWHYEKFTHKNADCNFFIQDDDRNYAITNYKLNPTFCSTITYGLNVNRPPADAEKKLAREQICKTHQIAATNKILLFNGTLNYKPNVDALLTILEKINPILIANENFRYKIIICGSKLPHKFKDLAKYKEQNIIYAGFVDDINLYFKGSDIFINPVIDGGGIKTKVVEALGYNLSVLSTESGAIGIPQQITGGKLEILPDDAWIEFANKIILMDTDKKIAPSYFDYFYWENIAAKAALILNQ